MPFTMAKLPLEIFFETLQKTDSKEEALKALKTAFVKRKLNLMSVERPNAEIEFEDLCALIEKERSLKEILKNRP